MIVKLKAIKEVLTNDNKSVLTLVPEVQSEDQNAAVSGEIFLTGSSDTLTLGLGSIIEIDLTPEPEGPEEPIEE